MKVTPLQGAAMAIGAIVLACLVGLATGVVELQVASPSASSANQPIGNSVLRWVVQAAGAAILVFWVARWFRKRRSNKPPGPWS